MTACSPRIVSLIIALCSITAVAGSWFDFGGTSRNREYERSYRHQRNDDWNRPPPPPPPRDDWNRQPPPPPPPRDNWNRQPPPPPPPRDNWGQQPPKGKHGKWQSISALASGGGAKEVSLGGGGYSECKIEIYDGNVSFNTIVVRRGSKKQSVTISARFSAGQSVSIPIDSAVTGIRISDGGRGHYRVLVK